MGINEEGCPASPAVHVRLLGGFRCEIRGEPRHLPLACQRVVAFIAMHDGPLLRNYVASNLWLDKLESRAAANLRSALWRLGKFDEPIVTCDASSVALHPEVSVDVERLTTAARRLADEPGEAEDGASLPELALFDRDLLPDWYEEWLVLERERLRHMRLHALDRLSDSYRRVGSVARAVDAACASIAGEPLRESAHRALISAHLEAGNRAEAVRQYERFRVMLRDMVGLQPSAELRSLLDAAFREPEPSPTPSPVAAPAVDGRGTWGVAGASPVHAPPPRYVY